MSVLLSMRRNIRLRGDQREFLARIGSHLTGTVQVRVTCSTLLRRSEGSRHVVMLGAGGGCFCDTVDQGPNFPYWTGNMDYRGRKLSGSQFI